MRVTNHALPAEPIASLSDFAATGGLEGLANADRLGSDLTLELIERAGIRGRGGGGFPTGRKWRSVRDAFGPADARTVVVNAAEGEPGTFKDRSLLRRNPYLVLEGALIGARTLGADRVVVATKARYRPELDAIRRAIGDLEAAGYAQGVSLTVVEGPDHYLFGEETALLEVIEGEDPLPRQIAPYEYGLFTTSPQLGWSAGVDESPTGPADASSNPTLVNNVETFAHVALVARNGVEWYRSMGTPDSPGPTIVTITGDVERAVVAEIELGAVLGDLIEELAGGVGDDRSVKAILSGVSNPVMTSRALSSRVTYEDLGAAGGGLGSAGFIVFDDRRNMVDVANQVLRFLHVESCGQCNPCKTGTGDIATGLEALVGGDADDPDQVLDIIARRLTTVTDGSRCYLPRQAQLLTTSLLQEFPDDLAIRRSYPGDLDLSLPKLVDIEGGVAVLDDAQHRKRPDWSYASTPVQLRAT